MRSQNWDTRLLALPRPSVRMELLSSHWTEFKKKKKIFEYFSKICRGNSSFTKIWQKQRILYMKTNIHFLSYLVHFFLEGEMFQTEVIGKIKTQIICAIIFFKSCRLWNNVEKYCTARQATDDNMTHAHYMLDIYGYQNTLRICNSYCFPTATVVARTRSRVTLYVHCLSRYFII